MSDTLDLLDLEIEENLPETREEEFAYTQHENFWGSIEEFKQADLPEEV